MEFLGMRFDYVVTVCDHAARASGIMIQRQNLMLIPVMLAVA